MSHAALRYDPKALSARPIFYHRFNTIDVFVEDIGDEEFYKVLLSRIAPESCTIEHVFGLGGRQQLMEECRSAQGKAWLAPRIYIADGDLTLILGRPSPPYIGLHVLDVYCIENYLIDKDAVIQVLYENSGKVSKDILARKFSFDEWLSAIASPLVSLFIMYAAACALESGIRTVSRGLHEMTREENEVVCLDHAGANRVEECIRTELVHRFGEHRVSSIEGKLKRAWPCRPEVMLRVVSAKTYLLPLLGLRMMAIVKAKCTTDSLRMRLAHHCSVTRMEGLREALTEAIEAYATPPTAQKSMGPGTDEIGTSVPQPELTPGITDAM